MYKPRFRYSYVMQDWMWDDAPFMTYSSYLYMRGQINWILSKTIE